MDYAETLTRKRLQKVISGEQGGISQEVDWHGGGSFVYCALLQLNARFVERIMQAGSDPQLCALYQEISKSDFISSRVDPHELDSAAESFAALQTEDKRRLLMQLLDLNLLYVNYSDIDDANFKVSDADKAFTRSFYAQRGAA